MLDFVILTEDRYEKPKNPDWYIQNIKNNDIHISTHPSFIYDRGDSYLKDKNQLDLNSLYRIGSLINSGVTVGYSSDAPVSSVNPFKGIYANFTRCTKSGNSL